MNKKRMIYIAGGLVLLLLIGSFAWKVQADKANTNAVNNRIDVIVDKVSAMFANDKKELLAENVSDKVIVEIEELIAAEKNTEMSDEAVKKLDKAIGDFTDAKQMLEASTLVEILLDDEGILVVEAVDIDNAEAKVKALQDRKLVFVELQTEIIEEARHQLLEIETAKAAVEALLSDQEKLTRKQYEEVLALVEVVKSEKKKAELMLLLDEVEKVLVKKETELAKKEEAKNQEETDKSTDNNNSSNPSKGVTGGKFESTIDGYSLGMTEKELLKKFADNNIQAEKGKRHDGGIEYRLGEDIAYGVLNGELVYIFIKFPSKISTSKGIKVGDSLKKVESIYGTGYNPQHAKYGLIEYHDGSMYLQFMIEEDSKVSGWAISKTPYEPIPGI